MFNRWTKTVIFALLLTFSGSQIVSAEVKVYQYDGKLPFVQMMLNMMVAMGILDRLPSNGGYSGYPLSRWSNLSNPYARAMAMRGFSPATSLSSWQHPYGQSLYGQSLYGNSPFTRSPWLSSPWSQSTAGGVSPAWGSPGWGVLPMESYSLNNYAWNDYSAYGTPGYSPYWSSQDINGWVNEPWENSEWNPRAEVSVQTPQHPAQQSPPPLVQNFNYNAPAKTLADDTPNTQVNKQSPLSKLAQAGTPVRQPSGRVVRSPEKQSPLPKRVRQRPCVTEFCGLKKPNLDGLWLAQNGEMLGVKNYRYLWSDSSSRYLTGQLKIQNEYLLANVDGHETLMRFKYKLAGNHLLTMQPDGVIREFTRMSGNQYNYPNQRRYYQ